jgi:hypothetical protein
MVAIRTFYPAHSLTRLQPRSVTGSARSERSSGLAPAALESALLTSWPSLGFKTDTRKNRAILSRSPDGHWFPSCRRSQQPVNHAAAAAARRLQALLELGKGLETIRQAISNITGADDSMLAAACCVRRVPVSCSRGLMTTRAVAIGAHAG